MPDDPLLAARMSPASSYHTTVDCVTEQGDWNSQHLDVERWLEQAFAETLAVLDLPFAHHYECTVVLTDNAHVQTLNATYRQQDKPTNILSFPSLDLVENVPISALLDTPYVHLGDMFFAYETVMAEMALLPEGLGWHYYLTHLFVHGLLHLFGYDHEKDAEAEHMEGLENIILKNMGHPQPYPTLCSSIFI